MGNHLPAKSQPSLRASFNLSLGFLLVAITEDAKVTQRTGESSLRVSSDRTINLRFLMHEPRGQNLDLLSGICGRLLQNHEMHLCLTQVQAKDPENSVGINNLSVCVFNGLLLCCRWNKQNHVERITSFLQAVT